MAEAVGRATHLLVSIAPGAADPVLAHYRDTILAAPDLKWIGYLSTVGVYGNYGGAWVSEATTPHPRQPRSVERLAAEKAWGQLAAERAVPLAVFRLAGIYGPGRNAFVNLAEGKAHRIVKPGQVFNRIHVDDIVQTLAAALAQSAAGIFNVADDLPAPPQDVVACRRPDGRSAAAEIRSTRLTSRGRSTATTSASPTAASSRTWSRCVSELARGPAALWREGTWRS